MTVPCPHCGAEVGEPSCVGCRQAVPFYVCDACKKQFTNPRFISSVKCSACNNYIFEESSKSNRHLVQMYVCQVCGHIEANPKFTHVHSCEGCKPPCCSECGAALATNSLLDYFVCSGCGKHTAK